MHPRLPAALSQQHSLCDGVVAKIQVGEAGAGSQAGGDGCELPPAQVECRDVALHV